MVEYRLKRTSPLVSNASQSAVPVGRRPILLHFHSPRARMRPLQTIYVNFCGRSVRRSGELVSSAANGAKAVVERKRFDGLSTLK